MRPFKSYVFPEDRIIANIGAEDKRSPLDPNGELFQKMKSQFLETVEAAKQKGWIPESSWVAWLNNSDTHHYIAERDGVLFGGDPDVVMMLSDKAWSLPVQKDWDVALVFDVDALHNVVQCLSDMEEHIRTHTGYERWVLKPRLGTSGRGFTYLEDVNTQSESQLRLLLRDQARSFSRLLAQGGFILEPWVDRVMDFSTQWWIHENGHIDFLGLLEQDMTKHGLCRGHTELAEPEGDTFLHRVLLDHQNWTMTLRNTGYYGPAGFDGFIYRDADGNEKLRHVNEVNPRFTMGTLFILGKRE